MGIVVLVFPLLFGWLVNRHNRVTNQRELAGNLRSINEEELDRLAHRFDRLPEGKHWLDRMHPYSYDLDIFGRKSLFQLLNRTTTPSGEYHLANWLLKGATRDEILLRQDSVKELSEDLHWAQAFQAGGRMLSAVPQADLDRLLAWLRKPVLPLPALQRTLSFVAPLLILATAGAVIAGYISVYVPILILIANGFLLRSFMDRVTEVTISTSGNARLLRSYASLIRQIEERDFSTQKLKDLKAPFHSGGVKATSTIQHIRRIADYLDARGNLFYQLLNFVFLLDIHLVYAAQQWKKRNHHDIEAWFSHIGEVEALLSLAGLRIAQPAFTFPALLDGEVLSVKEMGHPLIPPGERVVNDFKSEGEGHVVIITGSNMSGKSTFLRTIGINAVLAFAGGPVCAARMDISLFRVFTGMRTEDNLEEHISSFYAELKRIRQLLDYIDEKGEPVLYMLDEVLKGTNTLDRHKGSASLIKRLSRMKATGFVSTHDLELGSLAEELPGIRNFSFNSEIINNEIIFDYKITPGICRSFNASMLMKKIGILDDEN